MTMVTEREREEAGGDQVGDPVTSERKLHNKAQQQQQQQSQTVCDDWAADRWSLIRQSIDCCYCCCCWPVESIGLGTRQTVGHLAALIRRFTKIHLARTRTKRDKPTKPDKHSNCSGYQIVTCPPRLQAPQHPPTPPYHPPLCSSLAPHEGARAAQQLQLVIKGN